MNATSPRSAGTGAGRALVLRYHSLGDVILATGVVRALHDVGFRVEVITESRFADVFTGSPHLAALHSREADLPGGGFDRVVDLQGSPASRRSTAGHGPRATVRTRSAARRWIVLTGDRGLRPAVPHAALRYAEAAFAPTFGGPAMPALAQLRPEVFVTTEERAALAALHPELATPGPRPRVALLTGASRRSKAYPLASFAAVAHGFAAAGWEVLWVAAPKPSTPEEVEATTLSPTRSRPFASVPGAALSTVPAVARSIAVPLGALKALLASVQLAVSGDSGPMHLAAALGVPIVAVFGSSVRSFGFTPLGSASEVLEVNGLFCRPCGVHGRNRCWRGGFPCLDIAPEAVVRSGLALIERVGSAPTRPQGVARP